MGFPLVLEGFLPRMGARARGRVAYSAPVVLQPSQSATFSWQFTIAVFFLGFASAVCCIIWILSPFVDVDQL